MGKETLVHQLPPAKVEGVVTRAGLDQVLAAIRPGQRVVIRFEGIAESPSGERVELFRVTTPLILPLERFIQLVGPPRDSELAEGMRLPPRSVEVRESVDTMRGMVDQANAVRDQAEDLTAAARRRRQEVAVNRDGSKKCQVCGELDYNCFCAEPRWTSSGAQEGAASVDEDLDPSETAESESFSLEEILGGSLAVDSTGTVLIKRRPGFEPPEGVPKESGWVPLLWAVAEGWQEAIDEAERLDQLIGGGWRTGLTRRD